MEHRFSEALAAVHDTAERTLRELCTAPSLADITLSELWQCVDDPDVERFLEVALTMCRLLQGRHTRQGAHRSHTSHGDPAAFCKAYGISATDRQIVAALLQGCPLKSFPAMTQHPCYSLLFSGRKRNGARLHFQPARFSAVSGYR